MFSIPTIVYYCCFLFNFFAIFAKSSTGYAKVSNFGAKSPVPNEARSSGLSLYSQSSNAKVTGGQNLRSKIVYLNPASSKVGENEDDDFPAKGEVQERYNPRPYFQYAQVASNSDDHKTESKPAVVYGTPFKSESSPPSPPSPTFDTPPPSDAIPSQPSGLYNSPFSSYNPSKPPASPPSEDSEKPPGGLYESPFDSYNPKPDSPGKETYLPPTKPPAEEPNNEYPGYPYALQDLDRPSKEPDAYLPPQKPMEMAKDVDSYMPQEKDPKPEHDFSVYSDQGPQIVATVKPPESIRGYHQDSPPSFSYGKIPEYLDHDPKDHYHYHDFPHHPVYHEVTTTTTEMPEERVNKGHYSYYYLGRKLWYIPLYFSAYFIIYIAVLILKSIARHKVNFIHDLHDLGKQRSGRDMKIDEMTESFNNAISSAKQKFM